MKGSGGIISRPSRACYVEEEDRIGDTASVSNSYLSWLKFNFGKVFQTKTSFLRLMHRVIKNVCAGQVSYCGQD